MAAPNVRRVVTGHDSEGRAVIAKDHVFDEPSQLGRVIWSTVTSPADNTDETDGSERAVGVTAPGGTVFRVGQLEPGGRSPMHRTNSVDYGLVLKGEMGMELDGGDVVRLKAGDVVVQRGTNHVWFNDTDEPVVMAWILIDAEPVKIGDRVLEPTPFHRPTNNN
ncbi:cupin domain-containing protein [Streptomyces sp. NPDC091280]|uniref:cupin domain-containing protein n=1 Tax=Streptomyces sp. NPDC091280 TaxID=3365984 RepID=UPI0037FE6B68